MLLLVLVIVVMDVNMTVIILRLFATRALEPMQQEYIEEIAAKTDGCRNKHNFSIYFREVYESVNCFNKEPEDKGPNNENTRKCSEYFSSVITERK
mmetsp:Transcript_30769/g.22868  ORF Transcript_30769/g.22868 Transcript_30769/m.22868 type:complete len:96 (-) Transcript_30769:40-327(-)